VGVTDLLEDIIIKREHFKRLEALSHPRMITIVIKIVLKFI